MAELEKDGVGIATAVQDGSGRIPSATRKRGCYDRARERYSAENPRTYFREEHEFQGHFITWADVVDRGNSKLYISYKIKGDDRQFRVPREKSAWLDLHGLDYARLDIANWKSANNNSIGRGSLLPPFYLKHRREFLKWLHHTARHSTINGYEASLEQDIFPYFVGKLKLDSPSKWDLESISRWETFLLEHSHEPSTRNRKRTALRRYLRFLRLKSEIRNLPLILNEPETRESIETPIPGALPEWKDIVQYLNRLQPGRIRFTMAACAAFGVRISEALAITEQDFFGAESEQFINAKHDYIRKIKDAGLGALFLYVESARKRKVKEDIIKVLGEADDLPKSGKYTACCTNEEIAQFVVEMIERGEHLEDVSADAIYRFQRTLPHDPSPNKFHEYTNHDYRRLNITLQTMDLDIEGRIDVCCLTHAHSSREAFKKYFQWGLLQRRNQKRDSSVKLKVFKLKPPRTG
jgi:integrase